MTIEQEMREIQTERHPTMKYYGFYVVGRDNECPVCQEQIIPDTYNQCIGGGYNIMVSCDCHGGESYMMTQVNDEEFMFFQLAIAVGTTIGTVTLNGLPVTDTTRRASDPKNEILIQCCLLDNMFKYEAVSFSFTKQGNSIARMYFEEGKIQGEISINI